MLGCDATSLEVVQLDQINLGSGVFIADGDDGHLVAHPAHMLRIVRRVQEDGGKEAAAKRHIQICVLLLHPVIRVAADQMETVGGSSQLQFMKNKGIVGIRQITDQDQNGMLCAFPAALAALGLGIVQLPGRGKDPLGGLCLSDSTQEKRWTAIRRTAGQYRPWSVFPVSWMLLTPLRHDLRELPLS